MRATTGCWWESSDAATFWQHAAEDRDAAVASGISDPQSGADFGDEKGRKGIRELSRKSVSLGHFMPTRGRTGTSQRSRKPFGLKTGLEIRICKTLGVGASPIQD